MEYEIIVGLEVHAELKTKTKIFCGCKNEFGSEVNSNCCPICMGMPGTLPTLNEKVVEYAIKMGHATNCSINRICKQDRKNYFYPDLPKAYQISQFDIPLCEHGHLDVILDDEGNTKRIGITRIHIEEDAGKLIHDESFAGSLVDFNRCGVPLIEIVSEPDMRGSAEAKAYLDTIKAILQYIDVSDCKMQEGSIRCDVNVSVRPVGQNEFGTRVEMKNVNSFSGAVHAIEYESKRQIEVLEAGGVILQETRRWDEPNGRNVLLRSKEDAQDYRYFPEPDLLTIVLTEEYVNALKAGLPELPNSKIKRYMKEYGLPHFDADLLTENICTDKFFEDCIALELCQPKTISNWLLGDITRILHEKNIEISATTLTPQKLLDLLVMVEKGEISNTAAKTVLEEIIFTKKTAKDIVTEKGLAQVSDTAVLEDIVNQVLAANPKTINDYKNGKTNVTAFLMGQCMKLSKGKGNPSVLTELIIKKIKES
ncbi:MAG: Asp-tRNA(Asn)/Glu-tRNA(Gln) amidotransferase subunit GatB [Hydrogenoanaerobacterium sp.]